MPSSTSVLGPAYCISLAHKTDRRAYCRKQFVAEGLDVGFFDGIVAAEQGAFPTKGSRGAYLSHLGVLERVLAEAPARAATYATIFEDDVLLPRGFAAIVANVMKQLEGVDWHVVYWGTENHPPTSPVPGREPLVTIAPQQTIIGKQAYSIRLATAPGLIEYLKYCGEHHPSYSDGMFHEYRMKHDLPAYTHTLKQVRQASFASNITPGKAGWMRSRLQALKRQMQLWMR